MLLALLISNSVGNILVERYPFLLALSHYLSFLQVASLIIFLFFKLIFISPRLSFALISSNTSIMIMYKKKKKC